MFHFLGQDVRDTNFFFVQGSGHGNDVENGKKRSIVVDTGQMTKFCRTHDFQRHRFRNVLMYTHWFGCHDVKDMKIGGVLVLCNQFNDIVFGKDAQHIFADHKRRESFFLKMSTGLLDCHRLGVGERDEHGGLLHCWWVRSDFFGSLFGTRGYTLVT